MDLKVLMSALRQQKQGHVCIPTSLSDPLIEMKIADPIIGDTATIFMGMMDENYTEEDWNDHKGQLVRLFSITDLKCIGDIKVMMHKTSLDTQQLGEDMNRLIADINKHKPAVLRIVSLGNRWSPALSDALLTFIRCWQIPPDQKTLQLITLGESDDAYFLSFCKDICMKKTCAALQFYNAKDYDVFGHSK